MGFLQDFCEAQPVFMGKSLELEDHPYFERRSHCFKQELHLTMLIVDDFQATNATKQTRLKGLGKLPGLSEKSS